MSDSAETSGIFPTPEIETRWDETKTTVFTYNGLYSVLAARAPAKGVMWTESGTSYSVLRTSLRRAPGGLGTMTVVCIPFQISSSGGTPTSEHVEIMFAETSSQPLVFHPDFPVGTNNANVSAWQLFVASPEAVRFAMQYCTDPSDPATATALPSALEDWAKLYNKGITGFRVWLPVVTRVRTYECSPENDISDVGTIGAPPVVPAGWTGAAHWLKTGDDMTQEPGQGRWTRRETWTYAAEWPELLYSASSGGAS